MRYGICGLFLCCRVKSDILEAVSVKEITGASEEENMKAWFVSKRWLMECLIVSGCILLLFGPLHNNAKSFRSLSRSFQKDFAIIDTAVKGERYNDAAALKWIEDVDAADGYVDFYCGGGGRGSQTEYTGFFYTPADDPLAMWRQSTSADNDSLASDFVETESGWEYRESNHQSGGDNRFLVRKLAPCYYYYWLHY